MRYLGNCTTHLLVRCHVLRTIKCHASPIDRPIRDPARARAHTRRNLSLSFLSLFFLFIYLLLIPITHLHISPTDPAIYRSRLPVSNRTCAHIHVGVLARTHIHTRNIISARDDPTSLRLHVGLRMPSVRNTSVQCHVINRTNRCRTDAETHTHFIADSTPALFTIFNTTFLYCLF